jgi:hypothetical protein
VDIAMLSGGEAQRIKPANANAKTCAANLNIGDTRQAIELLWSYVRTPELCVIYGIPEFELLDYTWCPRNPAVSLGLRPTPSPAPVFSPTATMGDVY